MIGFMGTICDEYAQAHKFTICWYFELRLTNVSVFGSFVNYFNQENM